MNPTMKNAIRLFAVPILLVLLASCARNGKSVPPREDLFLLDIGPMEDQLSLFVFPDDPGMPRASVAMRDGFFYVSDGEGRKIVRYNSFGDMIFLIYNDETNPEPSDLKIRTEEDGRMTRWAFSFPFLSPGKIAVDSRRHIFVEEILPEQRHGFDAENQALLDGVVLHFDHEGRFVDFIGQGGPGGGPFPKIVGIHVSANDEIAVVARTSTGWDVFWYNPDGEQMFLVPLQNDAIPAPPDVDSFLASIASVMVAPDSRTLYVKVDYYREIYEPLTGNLTGIETLNPLVWILDVQEGAYSGFVSVPFYEMAETERGRGIEVNLPYSMLGVVEGGAMLFGILVDDGYALLRMDSSGEGLRRGFIGIGEDRGVFNSFHLSPEGVLSALLADEWTTAVSWWRMERFMRDG